MDDSYRVGVALSDDPWQADLEALGALLRAQRTAADLSLRELSERTKVSSILRDGNGAERQLRAYAAGGDPRAVAREIADVPREVSAGVRCA
jgi:hypothetical protein